MKINTILLSVGIAVALTMVGCQERTIKKMKAKESLKTVNHSKWGYEKSNGAEKWQEIEPDSKCDGVSQSPINIDTKKVSKESPYKSLEFNYKAKDTYHIVDNGHTIKVNAPVGYFKFNDVQYNLVQYHFHSGSEHTINGKRYPLEVHLVHKNEKKEVAVIGVLFEEGENVNTVLEEIYENVLNKDEKKKAKRSNDVNTFLTKNNSYYHYLGSFTTPPCTEGVNWFVMKDVKTVTPDQIRKIKSLMPTNNYRPIQPLNGRVVVSVENN